MLCNTVVDDLIVQAPILVALTHGKSATGVYHADFLTGLRDWQAALDDEIARHLEEAAWAVEDVARAQGGAAKTGRLRRSR